MAETSDQTTLHARSRGMRWLLRLPAIFTLLVLLYGLTAYVVIPVLWRDFEPEPHPALQEAPKTTLTPMGTAGDPLNVGLVGTGAQVIHSLQAAGWRRADRTTIRSAWHIADSVLRDRPYPDAPVSNLFLWGRPQDLAFEQDAGDSARRRHHVRFWQAPQLDPAGQPLWLGAATFDTSVGLSRETGQVTHHIAADIDAERNKLIDDLQRAGQLVRQYQVDGIGPTRDGRNGGGDAYFTDGKLSVGMLDGPDVAASRPADTQPENSRIDPPAGAAQPVSSQPVDARFTP